MRQGIGLARGSYVSVFLHITSASVPIDELDRIPANDMRLRHYSGEITSVDSSTMPRSRYTARELRNRATSDVPLGQGLAQRPRSRRHGYDPWRFHATGFLTVTRPPCKDHIRIRCSS